MVKLSKRVEYGIMALVHLEVLCDGERVSTRELSESYAIPEQHLGKVLQKMSKAGLIVSIQGAHGGYNLTRPLSEITLGELVEVLDGPLKLPHGGEDHALCTAFGACMVRGVMHEMQLHARNSLYNLNLGEVVERCGCAPAPIRTTA